MEEYINGLNTSIKRQGLSLDKKNKTQLYAVYKLKCKYMDTLKIKGQKKIGCANINKK